MRSSDTLVVDIAASPHEGADEPDDEAAGPRVDARRSPVHNSRGEQNIHAKKVKTLLRPAMGEESTAWARSCNR